MPRSNQPKMNLPYKVKQFPCRDCTDRHQGCHSDCKAYLEALAENTRQKDEYYGSPERQLERDMRGHIVATCIRKGGKKFGNC